MDSEVKQILKSLCFNYGWSYAVFWCCDPINPMFLRFEEAYKYDCEQSVAVVDDMILQPHIVGQGIVGEAFLTGNHEWLFSDTLLFQYEHEFQNQFLSGFKTIAVVPVGSSGVVQLGSVQKILESPEMLEQTTRALQDLCLKPEQSVELDTLFDSLVPLEDFEIAPESSLQGLSFDDIFTDDNPLEMMVSEEALNPSSSMHQDDGDDFGFDILKSYSVDDLYQLLADSPEEKCSSDNHQMVIQGNDKDLFDIFGINSGDTSSFSHQGLFSEVISSNTSSSCLTNVQDYCDYGLNQNKRRKLETLSAPSSSLFPQMICQEEDKERSSVEGRVKKKRAKTGENRRPRPKDRQMIQDRIKELRGMIPNGAKCSIDTLLDLTIRHMVLMQSIAKYADKLKQPYEVKEKERTLDCPIIVEDLSPQGQMQIEMVCEESGQFLEIADVMRGGLGLGLKVVKGVMERRQGQIWAHFIVQAKEDVTRLQVFWSLVQLFQKHHTDS